MSYTHQNEYTMNNYDPFAPACNAHHTWEKDGKGRWKYVGLTFDESEALLKWHGITLCGDDIVYPLKRDIGELSDEHRSYLLGLWDKHEKHRMSLAGR